MKCMGAAILAMASCLTPSAVMAWGAIVSYGGDGSYIDYNGLTEEAATAGALDRCRSHHGNRCEVKLTINGGALVVASGPKGQGYATGQDPREVRARALKACAERSGGCKIVNAAWDDGSRWFAFAYGGSHYRYVYDGHSPERVAHQALSRCEEANGAKGSCQLLGGKAFSGEVHVAVASSDSAGQTRFDLETTQEEADRSAMKACREFDGGPEDCKVVDRGGNTPLVKAPASFKAVATEAAANEKARAAPRKVAQAETRKEVLSCKTHCVNGDCTSVFDNGRRVKWRAPWVYLPMENRWGFNTQGCGG